MKKPMGIKKFEVSTPDKKFDRKMGKESSAKEIASDRKGMARMMGKKGRK